MTTPPTAPATAVAQLAAFAAWSMRAVPERVLADAKGRVLDVLGNCLAALMLAGHDEPHAAVLRALRRRGGTPEAVVIGRSERLPASSAALVNGALAHALDFDDTHLPSVLHPSASVVPAAVAVAEATGSSGRDLLAAIAVGDEICTRLGMAGYSRTLRASVFLEKGFHATSICGTVGAAAAAACLLGLDEAGVAAAMGVATSMGAGLIEANRTGGTVKGVHCGWAAHAGIEAAVLAAEGVTGPPTVFEGRFGFLRAYLDDDGDVTALTEGLGDRWEVLRTVYKPYPSNHFTHPGIDCALALRAEGLRGDDVVDAELGVAVSPLRTIGEPREEKVHPRTPYHAKFSGPYTVAAALLGGGGLGLSLEDFSPAAVGDPRRRALAEKVRVVPDARCTEQFPEAFSAVLRVRTRDGGSWEHRVDSSRGGPEHPLTADELATKFHLNAERVLHAEHVLDLEREVLALDRRADVRGLLPTSGATDSA